MLLKKNDCGFISFFRDFSAGLRPIARKSKIPITRKAINDNELTLFITEACKVVKTF